MGYRMLAIIAQVVLKYVHLKLILRDREADKISRDTST
jgi:hypothetical protein